MKLTLFVILCLTLDFVLTSRIENAGGGSKRGEFSALDTEYV